MLTIDYDVLSIDLLPVELRTDEHIEWLMSLTKPVKTIDTTVNTEYDSVIFDVQHRGQVLSLEHYLNTYFGLPFPVTIPNSIYIMDGIWYTELYTFINGADADSDLNGFGTVDPADPSDGQLFSFSYYEGADSIQDTVYMYSNDEYLEDQVDFIIMVSAAWTDSDKEDKIREIANKYKKVGHTFTIVTY